MMCHHAELIPFPDSRPRPAVRIQVDIARQREQLALRYTLSGALDQVRVPAPHPAPSRQDKLWETTCLEFFVAPRNSTGYWEFNLSPAGHWNVYRFDDYRCGMQPESSLAALPFTVHGGPVALTLDLQFDLNCLALGRKPLQMGLSAVIEAHAGGVTYWALAHCGPQPDFHQRTSFTLSWTGCTGQNS